jgi:hypothetical protein
MPRSAIRIFGRRKIRGMQSVPRVVCLFSCSPSGLRSWRPGREVRKSAHMKCMPQDEESQCSVHDPELTLPPQVHREEGRLWLRRWAVTLVEPLIETPARAEIERQVAALAHVEQRYFATYISGVLADLLDGLPTMDPWRRTSASEGMIYSKDGSPFGTWVDGADLLPREHTDLAADLNLAALASPLTDASARMLHSASGSWSKCRRTMQLQYREVQPSTSYFGDASSAVRWAIHRRRAYVGTEDAYVAVTCIAWIGRAERIVQGRSWDRASRVRMAESERVPEEAYTWLTS